MYILGILRVGDKPFEGCSDLFSRLSDVEEDLMISIMGRFHRRPRVQHPKGLPIHSLCYFQSNYPVSIKAIEKALAAEPEDDPSWAYGDSFGMTPLHILALSTKPNLELWKLLFRLGNSENF